MNQALHYLNNSEKLLGSVSERILGKLIELKRVRGN